MGNAAASHTIYEYVVSGTLTEGEERRNLEADCRLHQGSKIHVRQYKMQVSSLLEARKRPIGTIVDK